MKAQNTDTEERKDVEQKNVIEATRNSFNYLSYYLEKVAYFAERAKVNTDEYMRITQYEPQKAQTQQLIVSTDKATKIMNISRTQIYKLLNDGVLHNYATKTSARVSIAELALYLLTK